MKALLPALFLLAACVTDPVPVETPEGQEPVPDKPAGKADLTFIAIGDGHALHYVGDLMIVIRDFPAPAYAEVGPPDEDPDFLGELAGATEGILPEDAEVELTIGGFLEVKAPADAQNKLKERLAALRTTGWRIRVDPSREQVPMDGRRFMTDQP